MKQKLKITLLITAFKEPNITKALDGALNQETKYKYDIIVTYSDPFAGHDGMVYSASGWIFDGMICKDGHPIFFIDGEMISPRTLYDRHGTQSVPKMKEIYGNRLELKAKPLKKRFIKIINKKTRKNLNSSASQTMDNG